MSERDDVLDAMRDAHGSLSLAMAQIVAVGRAELPLDATTFLALGEAAGVVSKAKALLGRDIDAALAARKGAAP